MASHKISFYLNEYHIARTLTVIRRLDPTYQPSSIHQLIKTAAIDYCAKLSIGFSDVIPPEIWSDVHKLLPSSNPKIKPSSELELANIIYQLEESNNQLLNKPSTKPSTNKPSIDKPLKPQTIQQSSNHPTTSSALTEDQPTNSIKSTVDDFSFLTSLSNGDFND